MAGLTINELCDAYLLDRRNPHADRRCKHPQSLATHLRPARSAWGDMKVKEFADGSRMRVKAKVVEWREAKLNAHTIRKRISVLKTVFRFAVANELIKRRNEPVIELPPGGLARERHLNEDELARLLKAADHPSTPNHILLLIEILLRTGVRRGAALDLRWEHVDFDTGVIRFRDTEAAHERSKKRRGNKPMDPELEAIMRRAYEARDSEYVISWRGARVVNPYHALKRLYERAGLGDLRTHDLRRSSATYVHRETDGDLTAAANHIVDTEATARKHYVVESPKIHLRAMQAVSNVMERARGES